MMRDAASRALAGAPGPLGAHPDGRGTNFAVFAEHAEQVQLCLFDPSGRQELRRVVLPECTDGVWHGYLPEVAPGQVYGYRVHGVLIGPSTVTASTATSWRSIPMRDDS